MEDGGNLAEMGEKIAALERSEFDLKMQIFYLKQKLSEQQADGEQGVINVNMIEDRSVDILALRDDLEFSRQRIAELESEVLQLQLTRDNDALEYQKLMLAQPSADVALLEESRKREREIAKTLADHDTALIAKLQADIDSLQLQHEQDASLLEDCTARLAVQTEITQSKDAEIDRLQSEVAELSVKVSVLTDTARQQEQVLASAEQAKIELSKLQLDLTASRQENVSLTDQITRQEGLMATQADSLAYLRSEVARKENGELLRISAELSQALDERDEAVLNSQRVQYDNEVLRKQLGELRSIRGIPAPPESSTATGRYGRPGDQSPVIDTKIVEAYKKREAELLAALEGVIQRCQELEGLQHLNSQHQSTDAAHLSPSSARRMLNNRPNTSSFSGASSSTAGAGTYAAHATPGFKGGTATSSNNSSSNKLPNGYVSSSQPTPMLLSNHRATPGQHYSGSVGGGVGGLSRSQPLQNQYHPQSEYQQQRGVHTVDGRRSSGFVPPSVDASSSSGGRNSRSKSADKRRSWH